MREERSSLLCRASARKHEGEYLLFHLVAEKRDKITTELIVHISSGLDNEQDYALKGKPREKYHVIQILRI